MRKYSRKHGWMILHSYAPGDGAISFVWMGENDSNGVSLSEQVTESDVSEMLLEDEKGSNRWSGWEILVMWPDSRAPQIRLVEPATRPFHTSKKLIFRGEEYEYEWAYKYRGEEEVQHRPLANLKLYTFDRADGHKFEVKNASIRAAIHFFLTNEEHFEKAGFETRQNARRRQRTLHGVGVSA